MNRIIPLKLHFIFLQREDQTAARYKSIFEKEERLPIDVRTFYERAKELHPDWEVNIYNEFDAQCILSEYFPELLPVYNSYNHVVQKADILRVVLVYLFGGFYLDLDMLCLKRLDELCHLELVLAKEKIITEDKAFYLGAKHTLRIASYMFGGAPKHAFWLYFLKECINSCKREIIYEYDVIKSTGPDLLTNVFHSSKEIFKDITLLENVDRRCIVDWHEAISCHFGNFATHLHKGSWRWDGKKSNIKREKELTFKEYEDALFEIDCKLKNSSILNFSNILIQEPEEKGFSREGKLEMLYLKFKEKFKVAKTQDVVNKKVLVFGNPTLYDNRLSKLNINILYTREYEENLGENWITCVNESFNYCVVSNLHSKNSFIKAGVTIPIVVINLGFPRRRRVFDNEDDDKEAKFTIACFGNNKLNVESVINACERIKKNSISELKLRVITQIDQEKGDKIFKILGESRRWIEKISIKDILESGSVGIHCYLFLDAQYEKLFGPCEVLYDGTPVIIVDHPYYKELISSGYFSVINLKNGLTTVDEVHQSILQIFDKYSCFNEVSVNGASWIEDKWTFESTILESLRFIGSL